MNSDAYLSVFYAEKVELRKQSTCSLQLTNKTDRYIAFKVKTTNPKKYCVRPNAGVVLPNSTCNVIVTMQAPREAPPDMQSKDKFLIQSTIAPDGSTAKDLSPELFNMEAGKVINELKLRVVFVPANPPSPVPEESEEGSPPRALNENETKASSLSEGLVFDFKADRGERFCSSTESEAKSGTGGCKKRTQQKQSRQLPGVVCGACWATRYSARVLHEEALDAIQQDTFSSSCSSFFGVSTGGTPAWAARKSRYSICKENNLSICNPSCYKANECGAWGFHSPPIAYNVLQHQPTSPPLKEEGHSQTELELSI
nr:vesicle-associated protein 1-3 [Ipomoea batatas]